MSTDTPCHPPSSRKFKCACGLIWRWAIGEKAMICGGRPWADTKRAAVCGRRHVRGKGFYRLHPKTDTAWQRHLSRTRPPCEGVTDA